MKKLLLVLVAMFMMTGVAMALGSGEGDISCSCNAVASVAVSTASTWAAVGGVQTINLGLIQTNATCIAPISFYVWNNSAAGTSAVQKYQLSGAVVGSGTGWFLNSTFAADIDTCAVAGIFKSSIPASFPSDATCIITGTLQYWTWGPTSATGQYNYGAAGDYGKATHGNPYPGTAPSSKQLWIGLMTPSSVSSTQPKTIQITVTASLAG